MRFFRIAIATLLLTSLGWAQTIRVGAAISLQGALTEIAAKYEADTGRKVDFVFGSSGQVMAQIVNGAPIDAFISAAAAQVDELERNQRTVPGTRRTIAGNTLVLVVPPAPRSSITRFQDLAAPGNGKISIGEPTTVPAGQYAMQVLTKLNLADPLKDRLVYGSNVRQVLSYVERGEVLAGIVYSTDAKESGDKVRVVATASADTHAPIVYPAVVVKASAHQNLARQFLDFLSTEPARRILAEKGFSSPPSPATKPAE